MGEIPPIPTCLLQSGRTNRDTSPEDWSMTGRQWMDFVDACRLASSWTELMTKKGHVNAHDLNNTFVKPWTRGGGASISLRMNPTGSRRSQLMISHSWSEDIEECEQALAEFFIEYELGEDLNIWFCLFSQYQCGNFPGDPGPTIQEQIDLDPFGRVIEVVSRVHGMVVVHTFAAEVYDRLWCVYEITKALQVGCATRPAFSQRYIEESQTSILAICRVHTERASCSSEEDRKHICAHVKNIGGFHLLDEQIFRFRIESLKALLSKHAGRPSMRLRLSLEFSKADSELTILKRRILWKRYRMSIIICFILFIIMVGGSAIGLIFAFTSNEDDPSRIGAVFGVGTTTGMATVTGTTTLTPTTSATIGKATTTGVTIGGTTGSTAGGTIGGTTGGTSGGALERRANDTTTTQVIDHVGAPTGSTAADMTTTMTMTAVDASYATEVLEDETIEGGPPVVFIVLVVVVVFIAALVSILFILYVRPRGRCCASDDAELREVEKRLAVARAAVELSSQDTSSMTTMMGRTCASGYVDEAQNAHVE